MTYKRLFRPLAQPGSETAPAKQPGDSRDGSFYKFTDTLELAINVALASRRPLLVAGPSGTGKSALARAVAAQLGWRYLERVFTSRTEAQDLLFEIDHLRRLQDAQLGCLKPMKAYIRPGVLWRAFSPQDPEELVTAAEAESPGSIDRRPAVVLLDEIDKAEPDVPNNLLVPLGSFEFRVPPLGDLKVSRSVEKPPLIVITTNGERDLSPAFMRRCVEVELTYEGPDFMAEVGQGHYPDLPQDLLSMIANKLHEGFGGNVSIASFLDVAQVCRELEIGVEHELWQTVTHVAVGVPGAGRKAT